MIGFMSDPSVISLFVASPISSKFQFLDLLDRKKTKKEAFSSTESGKASLGDNEIKRSANREGASIPAMVRSMLELT